MFERTELELYDDGNCLNGPNSTTKCEFGFGSIFKEDLLYTKGEASWHIAREARAERNSVWPRTIVYTIYSHFPELSATTKSLCYVLIISGHSLHVQNNTSFPVTNKAPDCNVWCRESIRHTKISGMFSVSAKFFVRPISAQIYLPVCCITRTVFKKILVNFCAEMEWFQYNPCSFALHLDSSMKQRQE